MTVSADSLIAVTVEITKGLYWDAYLLPVSVLVDLTSGLLDQVMFNGFGVMQEITGGSYDDPPLGIQISGTGTDADTGTAGNYDTLDAYNTKYRFTAGNGCKVWWESNFGGRWELWNVIGGQIEQWYNPDSSPQPPTGLWPAVGSVGNPAPFITNI